MEFDGKERENSSPPLEYGDLQEPEMNFQNEIKCSSQIENRIRAVFTELQMYRSGTYDSKRVEYETNKYCEEISQLKQIIENIRNEGQRAAAAAERMVKERDAAIKRLAVVEPTLQALEKEKVLLEERAREMFCSLERIKCDENNVKIQLEADKEARINAEAQLGRLKQAIEDLQNNQSQLEEDLKLMLEEIQASKRLQEIFKTSNEHHQKQYQNTIIKLKDAIEKHAHVSGLLGEACAKMTFKNDACVLQREFELMQLVEKERAEAESLREALQTAVSSQAKILTLYSSPTFVNQDLNTSSDQAHNI